jgi:ATP-dependent Lon protease
LVKLHWTLIAEALGRKYVRISLGGLRDEAEIRGHRKNLYWCYAWTNYSKFEKSRNLNQFFVLDEIDKLSNSNQGDPSSALLEV